LIEPSYIFTIFMLTMGPLRVIPAFFLMTREGDAADCRALALRGAAWATAISVLVALLLQRYMVSWKVSLDALRISGGILLFLSALAIINQMPGAPPPPPPAEPEPPDEARRKALSQRLRGMAVIPLAMPSIVTPWGVMAILLFMSLARGDQTHESIVLGILLLMMALNLVGMLWARPIMKVLGMGTFMIIGWVFAVLQAGLGVEAVLISLRHMGVLPNAP